MGYKKKIILVCGKEDSERCDTIGNIWNFLMGVQFVIRIDFRIFFCVYKILL